METTTLGNMTEELFGVTEIAAFVGISRQRVQKLTETDADFPEPVAVLARGRVWSREAIEQWARDTGRRTIKEKG
jgi:prophage regulatory protein